MSQSIYVLADAVAGAVKIGCSCVPKERRRALSKRIGRDLELAFEAPAPRDAFRLERAIHHDLAAHRIAREWFGIGRDEAISAVKRQMAAWQ